MLSLRRIACTSAIPLNGVENRNRIGWHLTRPFATPSPTPFPFSTKKQFARNSLAGSGSAEDVPQRTRLIDLIRSIPQKAENYFRSPWRRALFGGIALFGGFYSAQTISLSFGAIGVNDVAASVICVLLTEYITKFYHTRDKPTFYVALLNVFKMGFIYGLFIDAFKLAS